MCSCDLYGSSEFYDVTYPRTRAERCCVECECTIARGQRYARHTQKWEGEVSSETFCVDCDAWSKALTEAQYAACGCSGWLYGAMWATIGEFTGAHLGYDPDTGEPRETEKQYRDRQEAMRNQFRVMKLDKADSTF